MTLNTTVRGCCCVCFVLLSSLGSAVSADSHNGIEYRVLATTRISTMEKELNEAAEAGFRLRSAMGGATAFGGDEVVVVMARTPDTRGHFSYKLLATARTSAMQRQLQKAANAGFDYKSQTVFNTALSGREVVVILERDQDAPAEPSDYRLVATSKTSTLQKELVEAGAGGYEVLGMTVGKTAFGGDELVAIARRPKAK
jgi:hypothetical protein